MTLQGQEEESEPRARSPPSASFPLDPVELLRV